MATAKQDLPAKKVNNINKMPLLLVIGGVLLLVGWLVSQAIPVWQAANSLLESQARAESLMANGLTEIDPDDAESLVFDIHRDVEILNRQLGPFLPLAAKLHWLPKIGPVLSVGPELMTMADAGSDSAYYAMKGLKPALSILQDEQLAGEERIRLLLVTIDGAEAELIQSSNAFDRLLEARNKIDNVDELPWRIRTLFERFDQEMPLALAGFKIAPMLPDIMALGDQKNYLLIAQNEDELRPTGGFISGAGLLEINDGAISSLTFEDGNYIDDLENKPYDPPPRPLQEFMLSELFLFRDANFWSDFPTSAEQAMALYSYSKEVPLDGAIAIDQNFLIFLLQAVGPIYSSDLDLQVDAQNLIEELRSAWEPDEGDDRSWLRTRKDFMGPLANALMTKLLSDFGSLDLLNLANSLIAAADQRHLQIYLQDPKASAVLADLGWNGQQFSEGTADYLQVIDTNMGFNKVNAVVDREIDYQVKLNQDGSAEAVVTITYTHDGQRGEEECNQGFHTYNPSTITYNAMVNDCYWNYLRVYTPGESSLISATSHPIAAESLISNRPWDGELTTSSNTGDLFTSFETFLKIYPGEVVSTKIEYSLPQGAFEKTEEGFKYSLLVQKQAGTSANPLVVRITAPPGFTLFTSSPEPDAIHGDELYFETALITDQIIELLFKPILEG